MNEDLIITGPMAKYVDAYKEAKNHSDSPERGNRRGLVDPRKLLNLNYTLPPVNLLSQIKSTIESVGSNTTTERKKFYEKEEGIEKPRPGLQRSRTLVYDGDIVYLSPCVTKQGFELIMMTTSLVTERTSVNFWKNETMRENPFAGFYKIRNVAYEEDNCTYQHNSRDTIKLGEPITFQVVPSGQYLCANTDTYADVEKNFIKICLSPKKNDISTQFSIRARFNNRVGGSIYYDDQIFITHEVSQLEIRMGGSSYGSSFYEYGICCRNEVNLGQLIESNDAEPFYWRIHKYSSSSQEDNDRLHVGDCVYIKYPHAEGFLWGSLNSSVFDKLKPNQANNRNGNGKSEVFYNKDPVIAFSSYDQVSAKTNHLKTVFMIENVTCLKGGILCSNSFYRLRHVASNTYLCLDKNASGEYVSRLCRPSAKVSEGERIRFLYSSIFQIRPICADEEKNGLNNFISSKNSVQLVHPISLKCPAKHYDDHLVKLLGGNFTFDEDSCIFLSMGTIRSKKKKEYLPLIGDGLAFNIPQEDADGLLGYRKATLLFTDFPEECDSVFFDVVDKFFTEIISKSIDMHCLIDSFEADFYKYARIVESDRGNMLPCSEDTLLEITATAKMVFLLHRSAAGQCANLSAFSIFDSEDLTETLQNFSCFSRILDRFLWIMHLPHSLGLAWSKLIEKSEGLEEIYILLQKVIKKAGNNNSFAQEYIARGKLKKYRALVGNVASEKFSNEACDVENLQKGYVSTLVWALSDINATDSAGHLLEELLYKNALLSRYFTTREFIGHIAELIKKRGPSKALLELLACVVSGSGEKNTRNGELILEVLCSTGIEAFHLDNRVMTMIETSQDKEGKIFVSWNGSVDYDPSGDVDHFFYDASSLGIMSTKVYPSAEFKSYLTKRGEMNVSSVDGVLLVDLAWHLDPSSLYHFWNENDDPRKAWNIVTQKNEGNSNFLTNESRLHSLAGHYFGVINLYKELCKDCARGWQYLERQFEYDMLVLILNGAKIPLPFKRLYLEVLDGLYVSRYPNVLHDYPNHIVTKKDLVDIHSMESAIMSCRFAQSMIKNEVSHISAMRDELFVENEDGKLEKMTYRDYLLKHQPHLASNDSCKYDEIQDATFRYFFVERNSSIVARFRQANIKNEIEVQMFERASINMISNLLRRGFCASTRRLAECLKVAYLVVQSVDKQKTSKKNALNPNKHHAVQEVSILSYNMLPQDDGDISDDDNSIDDDSIADEEAVKHSFNFNVDGFVSEDFPKDESDNNTSGHHDTTFEEKGLGSLVSRLCKQHDEKYVPTVVVEAVYENQRWSGINYLPNTFLHPLGPFNSQNPLLNKVFSYDHPIHQNLSDPSGLPHSLLWAWLGDWKIQPIQSISRGGKHKDCQATDPDGWFYAFDWPAEFHPEASNFKSYVRRRKWERVRKELTAEQFFQRLLQNGYDRNDVHKVCTLDGVVSPSGVIDFNKVLTCLRTIKKNSTPSSSAQTSSKSEKSIRDIVGEKDCHQHWLETLASGCQLMNRSYDLILNARMMMFLKDLNDEAPPKTLENGTSAANSSALWYLFEEQDRKVVSLTSRGVEKFRKLFNDLSCTRLIFGSDNQASDKFILHMVKVVMEDHHELCDSALTVLRRELNQVSDLMNLLRKTVLIADDEQCQLIEKISIVVICLQEDTECFLSSTVNLCQSDKFLVDNLCRHCSILQGLLANRNSDFIEDSICERKGHEPLLRILLSGLKDMYRRPQCSLLCPLFKQTAEVLCRICQKNITAKSAFLSFMPAFFKVFDLSEKERGCGCIENSCIKLISSVFKHFDYNSAIFSVSLLKKCVSYLNPDQVKPSALFSLTQLIKDVLSPNRKFAVAPFQLAVSTALPVELNNRVEMFFENKSYQSTFVLEKRLSMLREYNSCETPRPVPSTASDNEKKGVRDILFHAECVEILALCCEEVSNQLNSKLSSLFRAETLISVMIDEKAGCVDCYPLLYSYGLFIYRVYLKNCKSAVPHEAYSSDGRLLDLFSSDQLWVLLHVYTDIASANSSLLNEYRPFVFDVAIPTITAVLNLVSSNHRLSERSNTRKETQSLRFKAVKKSLQDLLLLLLSRSLSEQEASIVQEGCRCCNIPFEKKLEDDDESSNKVEDRAIPPEDDYLGIYDTGDEFEYEMSGAVGLKSSKYKVLNDITNLLGNCKEIERIREETSVDSLISALTLTDNSVAEVPEYVSSTISDLSTDNPLDMGQGFFSSFVKRLTIFATKVVASMRTNERLGCASLENVKFVFDIFTKTLMRKRMENDQSQEFEDLQHIMNNNGASELIIEVIAAVDDPITNDNTAELMGYALKFGQEVLYNGNRQCQRSIFDALVTDSNSRANNFFISISKSIKRYTEIIRSMLHSRNGIKELDMTGDLTSRASSDDEYLSVLSRAQSMFRFLQLLCEGHYLSMQEVFEDSNSRYHILTSSALLFEQILPINVDVSCLQRSEALVAFSALDFFIESVQGPCMKNQEILAGHERFVCSLGRWSSSKLDIQARPFLEFVSNQSTFMVSHQSASMSVPVDFFLLKLIKNKCLLLRLGFLEGRTSQDSSGNLKSMHEKLCQGSDERSRLQSIYQEYRTVKKYCRQNHVNVKLCQIFYKYIRAEAHLTISYYTAIKRWMPFATEVFTPVKMEIVRRKRMGSHAEYINAQRAYKRLEKYKSIYSSFMDRQRNVEVFWKNRGLFQVSFQKPRKCEYMTEEIKNRAKSLIRHDNDDKVAVFLNQYRVIGAEMELQMNLKDRKLHFLLFFQDELNIALIALSFLINFIMAISLEKGYFSGKSDPQYSSHVFSQLMTALQYLQFIGYLSSLIQAIILVIPVAREERHEAVSIIRAAPRQQMPKFELVYILIKHFVKFILIVCAVVVGNALLRIRYGYSLPSVLVLSLLLVVFFFCKCLLSFANESLVASNVLLGYVVITLNILTASKTIHCCIFTALSIFCLRPSTPYFNSLMLLAIASKSSTLQNVVKSVTIPFTSLALSALLGLICIFIFAVFGFYFFPNEFYNEDQNFDECSNILFCFVTFLHSGFLSGGGIADHISNDLGHEPILADSTEFSKRVTYDIAFFVIIVILLLNIIFGIIIDTFGSLREKQKEQTRLETSFCFICGISKEEFDARALFPSSDGGRQLDFAGHVRIEHNMWDYLFFRLYLHMKDPNDFNGIESYISDLIRDDDISWIPRGQTVGINDKQSHESSKPDATLEADMNNLSLNLQGFLSRRLDASDTMRKIAGDELQETLRGLRDDIDILKAKISDMESS